MSEKVRKIVYPPKKIEELLILEIFICIILENFNDANFGFILILENFSTM